MPVPQTTVEFIQLLERSELLERHKLQEFIKSYPDINQAFPTPKECALYLLNQSLLTNFQAKLLLQGKWKNFYIGGKYKVLEHLGTGGMGTVYLCEHRFMRRRVAIKLLPPDKSQSIESLERFRREAQAIARLNHPNLVHAHDIDQDAGIHYLVMEYIDGISLQALVEIRGSLDYIRAVNYIAQTATGLQHACKMSLVHRDIKPNNLILDRSGIIKILDLGLARFSDNEDGLTKRMDSKAVLGTADYLAPEQAISSSVDIRADIYSLGCVFYFLLVGKPVFDGGSVAMKLVSHQTREPLEVHRLRSDVPVELSKVISKMLSKKPEARYQMPIEVIQAIHPWLRDVPPPTPEELPASRFMHHRDLETMSKMSTMGPVSRTTHSFVSQYMNSGVQMGASRVQ